MKNLQVADKKLRLPSFDTARYEKRYHYKTPKVRPFSKGASIGLLITAQIKNALSGPKPLTVCTAARLFAERFV